MQSRFDQNVSGVRRNPCPIMELNGLANDNVARVAPFKLLNEGVNDHSEWILNSAADCGENPPKSQLTIG